VEPGDVLLLYTDGIVDSENRQSGPFGTDRLRSTLRQHRGLPAQALCATVEQDVFDHAGGQPAFDDLTLAVLRCVGS
jgi:sigma-B regulation protein RsbU (phosphoserine phosphatase)